MNILRRAFSPLPFILGLGCVLLTSTASPTTTPPHNVLLICIDDLRNEIGPYGFTHVRTPNLNKFARTATTFQRSYVQYPVCGPSRASMLTGRRPDTTQVYDLAAYFRRRGCNVSSLPQFFKERNYRTFGIGKIFQPGKAAGDIKKSNGKFTRLHDNISWSERYYWGGDGRGNKFSVVHDWIPEEKYPDSRRANKAVKTLGRLQNETKPFFLAVGFTKPHLPFYMPDRFWNMYKDQNITLAPNKRPPKNMPGAAWMNWGELVTYGDVKAVVNTLKRDRYNPYMPEKLARKLRRGYWACITYIDEQVGKVLRALEESGKANTTTVVVWSDHGWELGEHGEWGKYVLFEDVARAPLLIRSPKVPASMTGRMATTVVESVDIYPTLVDLAGFDVSPSLQGRSLARVLAGEEDGERFALTQVMRNSLRGYSIRTRDWRYTIWIRRPVTDAANLNNPTAKELYNHTGNRGDGFGVYEESNVVAAFPSIAQELHKRLIAEIPRWVRPRGVTCAE